MFHNAFGDWPPLVRAHPIERKQLTFRTEQREDLPLHYNFESSILSDRITGSGIDPSGSVCLVVGHDSINVRTACYRSRKGALQSPSH